MDFQTSLSLVMPHREVRESLVEPKAGFAQQSKISRLDERIKTC